MKPDINIALLNAAQEILNRFSPLIEDEYEIKSGNDDGDVFVDGYKIAYIFIKDDIPSMKFIDRNIEKFDHV